MSDSYPWVVLVLGLLFLGVAAALLADHERAYDGSQAFRAGYAQACGEAGGQVDADPKTGTEWCVIDEGDRWEWRP